MKKASVQDMELGNLIFGNSRGNYVVPRDSWQDIFAEFLFANDFDSYGFHNGERGFENYTFIIRPYYWGEDEEIQALPNFVYKPENITISWYKYPMRDAYCSHNISDDKFREIVAKCNESMRNTETT